MNFCRLDSLIRSYKILINVGLLARQRDEIKFSRLEYVVICDVDSRLAITNYYQIVPGFKLNKPVDSQNCLGLSCAVESLVVMHIAVRVLLDGIASVRTTVLTKKSSANTKPGLNLYCAAAQPPFLGSRRCQEVAC